MAIYRFTMKKTMRSISNWVFITLAFLTITLILIPTTYSTYIPLHFSVDEVNDVWFKTFRGLWIWVMRVLVFFFLFIFISIKAANIFRDEIDEGTLLIIVSKPISRWKIFWEKWLALQTNVLILVTISLWGPLFITMTLNVLPAKILKWLLFNITLTWIFTLFVQLIITSIAIMLSLTMGSKGCVALFSSIGALGFIAWIPTLFWIGLGSEGNGVGNIQDNDGGLSNYFDYVQSKKQFPILFDQVYKQMQNNDGAGIYDTFADYYKSIVKEEKVATSNTALGLSASKREEIVRVEDFEYGNRKNNPIGISSINYKNNYLRSLMLDANWLKDYQTVEMHRYGDQQKRTENIIRQTEIINNLDFDKFTKSSYFKTIFGDYNKVTFQINIKNDSYLSPNSEITHFNNATLYFWENEVDESVINRWVEYKPSFYKIDYTIKEFSSFLDKYNKKIDAKDENKITMDQTDQSALLAKGYNFKENKSYYENVLLFSYSYDDIKNDLVLRKQLMKKLLSIIPLQFVDSNNKYSFDINTTVAVKNNLLNYLPSNQSYQVGHFFSSPVGNAFNKSAILAEKYYNALQTLKDKHSEITKEDLDYFIRDNSVGNSKFIIPKLAYGVKTRTKFADNIKKNNIFSIFNFYGHFEKMFKAMVEPNENWGIVGLSTPYELSLKYYYNNGQAFGPLLEESTYRGDKPILFTVYVLITVASTLFAVAVLKLKNLT